MLSIITWVNVKYYNIIKRRLRLIIACVYIITTSIILSSLFISTYINGVKYLYHHTMALLSLCRFVVLTNDNRVVHYCKYNAENGFKYTLTVFARADLLNRRIVNGTEKKNKNGKSRAFRP